MRFILVCATLLASSILARPQDPSSAAPELPSSISTQDLSSSEPQSSTAIQSVSSATPESSISTQSVSSAATQSPTSTQSVSSTGPQFSQPAHSPPQPLPLQAQQSQQHDGSTPIPIVSQTEEINPDGSFKYSYETGNGIKVEESQEIKNIGSARSADSDDNDTSIQVRHGSFSFTGPDGTVYSVTYTADENGFLAQGDHLPTAPPVPEAIAKSLSNQTEEEGSEHEQQASAQLLGQQSLLSSQQVSSQSPQAQEQTSLPLASTAAAQEQTLQPLSSTTLAQAQSSQPQTVTTAALEQSSQPEELASQEPQQPTTAAA